MAAPCISAWAFCAMTSRMKACAMTLPRTRRDYFRGAAAT